jgi:hypothetical protein
MFAHLIKRGNGSMKSMTESEEKRGRPEPIQILVEGNPTDAFIKGDAARYLGVTPAALQRILERTKIQKWKLGFGSEVYILKRDLDVLLQARPADG